MIKEPKKFNAKLAKPEGSFGGLSDFQGIQIVDPDEVFRDLEEDDTAASKSGPIETYSPKTITRQPQKNEILKKPSEWLTKARELITRPSRNKKTKGKQREEYQTENMNNKIGMGANYAYIDRLVRESDAYKCPNCGGAKHGGKPQNALNQGGTSCEGCGNTGSTLRNPEQSIFNITEHARNFNRAIAMHEKFCGTGTAGQRGCWSFQDPRTGEHRQCIFKDAIDKNVRNNSGGRKLKLKETHLRSGSSDFIKGLMRPMAVVDNYKGFAPVLQRLRGHEDEPLRMGDVVHAINNDTINPDSDIIEKDSGFHRYKESYEIGKPPAGTPCQGCNGKGTYKAWPVNIGHDNATEENAIQKPCLECKGTGKKIDTETDKSGGFEYNNQIGQAIPQGHCAVCGKEKNNVNHITVQRGVHDESGYFGMGRDKQQAGIIHRVNEAGTHADVFVYYRPIEGIRKERSERINGRPDKNISMADPSDIDERSSMAGINRTSEPDPAKRAVNSDIESAYAETLPMSGERSPLQGRGIWKLHRNVPIHLLQRLSPVTAPLLATSGVIKRTAPKSSIIGILPGSKAKPTHCDNCSDRVGETRCSGASPDISDHCPSCPDNASSFGKHVSDKKPADPKVQTNTVYRNSLGISTEDIRNMHKNTPDLETQREARILQRNLDTAAGLPEGHQFSVSTPIRGAEVAEQHRTVKPTEIKPLQFNSGSFDKEPNEEETLGKATVPQPTVPDSLPGGIQPRAIGHGEDEEYDF